MTQLKNIEKCFKNDKRQIIDLMYILYQQNRANILSLGPEMFQYYHY